MLPINLIIIFTVVSHIELLSFYLSIGQALTRIRLSCDTVIITVRDKEICILTVHKRKITIAATFDNHEFYQLTSRNAAMVELSFICVQDRMSCSRHEKKCRVHMRYQESAGIYN